MKVIDLLNKIANGEEVPKKIRYCNIDYYWTGCNYENSEACEVFFWDCICSENHINDEVEFIEEDKKIEKLVGEDKGTYIFYNTSNIADKINEIIDVINKGD